MTPSDLLALHDSATAEVQRLVDGVDHDQFDDPTPCPEWDVRSLLGHLVAGNRRFAAAARGESLMALIDEVAPEPDASVYAESARLAADAWRDPSAFEQENAEMAVTVHLAECVQHGWDLARATEQHAEFDDAVLDVVEPFAHSMMPAERPEGMGFGPPTEPPASATRLDQLAAFYGRDVSWPEAPHLPPP
jgi:uncharacterized protein (TIGR03086 family)